MINLNHIHEIASPLDQFIIRDLISINAPLFANLYLAITNIGLYLGIATFIVLMSALLANNYNNIIANT